jgi:hypothetical protein
LKEPMMKTLLVRCGLLACGFAFAVAASHALASAHGDAITRAPVAETNANTVAARPTIAPATTLASDDPLVLEAREARATAHATDVVRREVKCARSCSPIRSLARLAS